MSPVWEKEGYILRLAEKGDAESYFNRNFNPLEPDLVRFTGCKPVFQKEEVLSFLESCVEADDRYDFLLLSPEGQIIGESVLNEIDWDVKCANFRIAIFHRADCAKGLGSWAVEKTLSFAFTDLGLHRVELDVFSFNHRAIHVYEKAGFRREGIRREAVRDGDGYADDILMAILEEEWRRRE